MIAGMPSTRANFDANWAGSRARVSAAAFGIRQAECLLPAVHAHAGEHTAHSSDIYSHGYSALSGIVRRWEPVGYQPLVRRAAQSRGLSTSIHYRSRLRRWWAKLSSARR